MSVERNVAKLPRKRADQSAGNGDDWRSALRRRGDGIIGDEANLLLAFRSAPELDGMFRLNEFSGKVEFARPPPWRRALPGDVVLDADDLDAMAWLQHMGVPIKVRGAVADVIERVARDAVYHPIRQYLQGLQWDGKHRLQVALVEYFTATAAPADYLGIVFRKFLVQCVARVMRPGCQADATLVLESPQGYGKSRAVRIFARKWGCENLPHDLGSKDAAGQLAGAWLVELAELAALKRSDIEAMKSFLTRCVDRYRPSYARRTVDVPRQCCFIATTNEEAYLRDRTGNRRFWPVRCGRIDLDALERNVDQLWAEAFAAYIAGDPWHLSDAEAALQATEAVHRELVTELEVAVATYLDGLTRDGRNEVSTREVLIYACRLDPDATDYIERAGRLGTSVATAMVRYGWVKVRQIGSQRKGTRSILYRRSEQG